jgi:phosphoribosyl 1,2-cyclic phosphodiesterase
MTTVLHVLGSGSSGNAALLRHNGFGVLIDSGIGPVELTNRLQIVGETWAGVNAVLLTHTHTDHWNKHTLAQLRRLNIPFVAHEKHHQILWTVPNYDPMHRAGLLRTFTADSPLTLNDDLTLRVCQVSHDADPTFALRVESSSFSVGWATDLGFVPDELLQFLHGVDVLGMEFNHDLDMEKRSRRPRHLIERVLSDTGHLSNNQAAEALSCLAAGSDLQTVVQLHLSRDCNTADLAHKAGRNVVGKATRLVTAKPFEPCAPIVIDERSAPPSLRPLPPRRRPPVQLVIPGIHEVR